MTVHGYKERTSPLSCSFANVSGAEDCLAILLFLGYLWNNQFNWADDYLVPVLHFWLRSLFPVVGTDLGLRGKGMACIQQARIPELQATPSLPLPIWFLRNLPWVAAGKKKNGEGTPCPPFRSFHRIPPLAEILSPLREKAFYAFIKMKTCLGCSL